MAHKDCVFPRFASLTASETANFPPDRKKQKTC